MKKASVQIYMFGKFEVLVNGKIALKQLKQSKKTLLFLQYLILKKDKPVLHEELFDTLWSEADSSNPSTALRTMLHRFRTLIDACGYTALKNCILTNRGAYQWNSDLDCVIDVYEMERLSRLAADEHLPKEVRKEAYAEILDLYIGPLLPAFASELWVIPKSVYYHNMYLESILKYIGLLKEDEDYDGIVSVCRRAMDVDVYDERLHMELMLALIKLGKSREALSQYYYTTNVQYNQQGAQPSQEIRSIYKQILQTDKQMESDLDGIQRSLLAEDEQKGAFVCDYEIFSEIYQLQRRMLTRQNASMFIALITVGNSYDKKFDPLMLDNIMWKLLDVAKDKLRRGDTISRFSATQFVVLLPSVNYETGNTVIARVKQSFYDEYQNSSVVLNYKLRPLRLEKEPEVPALE